MGAGRDSDRPAGQPSELDLVVAGVVSEALATGGYSYFVLNLFADGLDEKLITTIAAVAAVAFFAVVQWLGSQLQARLMEWMTYGAIVGLVWFWIACIPGVRLDRIFTEPL